MRVPAVHRRSHAITHTPARTVAANRGSPRDWICTRAAMSRTTRTAVTLASILFACSHEPPGGFGSGASPGGSGGADAAATDVASSSGGSGADSDEGGDDGTTDDARFDVPSGDSGVAPPDGGGPGCKKVDFLFVIDNSGSMLPYQDNLVASYGGFMDAIRNQLAAQDYHVMAVTTGTMTANCEEYHCTDGPIVWPPPCPGYQCGTTLAGCDATLGAGNVLDAGLQACALTGEDRWLDAAATDAEFACVARPGAGGDDIEKVPQALLAATSAELNADGACNAGFLRDDAILVVTIVTDELAHGGAGGPQDWYDALVANKGGNADAIVMLTLTGPRDAAEQQLLHCYDPFVTPEYHTFAGLFGEHGLDGSVCAASYDGFFAEAVALVDSTCDEFEPEG